LMAAAMSKLENSFLRKGIHQWRVYISVDYKITVCTQNPKKPAKPIRGPVETINTWASFLSKNPYYKNPRNRIQMSPVVQLYWMRVLLGIVAGAIAAIFASFMPLYDYTTLINSVTVALLVYFITYYILRATLKTKIEPQSKILTTGIGIYFFSWILFFVLFYTVIQIAHII